MLAFAAVQGYGFVPPSQVRSTPGPITVVDKHLLRKVLPTGGPGVVQHVGTGGAACCPFLSRRCMLLFVRHSALEC